MTRPVTLALHKDFTTNDVSLRSREDLSSSNYIFLRWSGKEIFWQNEGKLICRSKSSYVSNNFFRYKNYKCFKRHLQIPEFLANIPETTTLVTPTTWSKSAVRSIGMTVSILSLVACIKQSRKNDKYISHTLSKSNIVRKRTSHSSAKPFLSLAKQTLRVKSAQILTLKKESILFVHNCFIQLVHLWINYPWLCIMLRGWNSFYF